MCSAPPSQTSQMENSWFSCYPAEFVKVKFSRWQAKRGWLGFTSLPHFAKSILSSAWAAELVTCEIHPENPSWCCRGTERGNVQTAIVSSEFAFSRPSSFNNLIITQKVKNCHQQRLHLMTCLTVMLVLHSLAQLIIYLCLLIFKIVHLNKRFLSNTEDWKDLPMVHIPNFSCYLRLLLYYYY